MPLTSKCSCMLCYRSVPQGISLSICPYIIHFRKGFNPLSPVLTPQAAASKLQIQTQNLFEYFMCHCKGDTCAFCYV